MKCEKCGAETGASWKHLCLSCYKAEKKAERERKWQDYCKQRIQDEWDRYCDNADMMNW